jgi:GT2 family glycosyltransferase
MRISLDIIIVNWNAGQQLANCLTSIIASDHSSFNIDRIVIVDNASTDESFTGIQNMDLPSHLIRNKFNAGFAAACNQGAQTSRADYLLFLNPDTVLFGDSLEKSVNFISQRKQSKLGIVGIQLVDENGVISRTCCRFPDLRMFLARMTGIDRVFPNNFRSYYMNEWDHKESRIVDHVIGAFYLVDRHLFESILGFDERFFVYLEDLDFSLRAHKAGWYSHYLAEAQAYHKGGGTSEQVKARRLFYSLRSRIIYCYKHFGWESATSIMFATLFIEPISRIMYSAVTLSGKQMIETIRGYIMLWRDSPKWISIIKMVKE